ncbi:hypothetical protein [Aeromicrobium camelliae]|uniref:hypothetical protein n=1 Tax=Aeromicrobium camelliae TaxID=1538144 RepID=UPI00140AEFC8|nr:hypothetical protein [Aeromicrobium camelliae]
MTKVLFLAGVALSAVFLVISIVSWNLALGLCALVLAMLLTRRLDLVGVDVDRNRKGN